MYAVGARRLCFLTLSCRVRRRHSERFPPAYLDPPTFAIETSSSGFCMRSLNTICSGLRGRRLQDWLRGRGRCLAGKVAAGDGDWGVAEGRSRNEESWRHILRIFHLHRERESCCTRIEARHELRNQAKVLKRQKGTQQTAGLRSDPDSGSTFLRRIRAGAMVAANLGQWLAPSGLGIRFNANRVAKSRQRQDKEV
jgi:hypothetical protein